MMDTPLLSKDTFPSLVPKAAAGRGLAWLRCGRLAGIERHLAAVALTCNKELAVVK